MIPGQNTVRKIKQRWEDFAHDTIAPTDPSGVNDPNAPYQTSGQTLTFGQTHPILGGLGGAALGFLAEGMRPNSTLGSAIAGGALGGIQTGMKYGNEAAAIRAAQLKALQDSKIKNLTAKETGYYGNQAMPGRADGLGNYSMYTPEQMDKQIHTFADTRVVDPSQIAQGQMPQGAVGKDNIFAKQGLDQQQNVLNVRAQQAQTIVDQIESNPSLMQDPVAQEAYKQAKELLGQLGSSGASPDSFRKPMTGEQVVKAPGEIEAKRIENQYAAPKAEAGIRKDNASALRDETEAELAPVKAQFDNLLKSAQAGEAQAKVQITQAKQRASQGMQEAQKTLADPNAPKEAKIRAAQQAYGYFEILNDFNTQKIDSYGERHSTNPYLDMLNELSAPPVAAAPAPVKPAPNFMGIPLPNFGGQPQPAAPKTGFTKL